jgi:hypothetical protein
MRPTDEILEEYDARIEYFQQQIEYYSGLTVFYMEEASRYAQLKQSLEEDDKMPAFSDDEERKRKLEVARRNAIRIKELAPDVPDRAWTPGELAVVFLNEGSLLKVAIYLNRNYSDVAKTALSLTAAYKESPEILVAGLGLSSAAVSVRAHNDGVTPVVD